MSGIEKRVVEEPLLTEVEYVLPGFHEEVETYTDAGLTEDEAVALAIVTVAANEVLALDTLHPMLPHEVATQFHHIQARLFMRPAYRAYLDRIEEPNG